MLAAHLIFQLRPFLELQDAEYLSTSTTFLLIDRWDHRPPHSVQEKPPQVRGLQRAQRGDMYRLSSPSPSSTPVSGFSQVFCKWQYLLVQQPQLVLVSPQTSIFPAVSTTDSDVQAWWSVQHF